jgi:hypothetical protein
MIDRASLRLSATLLLVGQLLYIVVTQFHTDGSANNHPSVFAEYARSGDWKGVHVAQFAAAAILLAGLIALFFALDLPDERARWLGRFGTASAVVALALYGVLQAVDGVGNKQVDHAWVSASDADKAARFASAESMRWLEWGVRSYLDYALGLALLLFGMAIVMTARIPRPIGYLMGLSGLAYFAQGGVVGSQGFSTTHDSLIVLAWIFSAAWMIWLVVVAWRWPDAHARSAPRSSGEVAAAGVGVGGVRADVHE